MKTYFQKILKCPRIKLCNLISISQLTEEQSRDCEFILSEKDVLLVSQSMPNNKSPDNGGLLK